MATAACGSLLIQSARGGGTHTVTAALLADTCVTLLHVALDEWLDQVGERPLAELIPKALQALQALRAAIRP